MKAARTWIVVADGARARFFENCGPGKGMAPLSDGEKQGSHSTTREIGSDRPGRVHGRMGPGRHAMAPRVDWHEQQKQDFLKALAARLDRAAARKAFDRLILVAPAKALDRTVTIRFDANTTGGLAWRFRPDVQTMNVRIGEETLAFYRAKNTSQQALTGSATFNVAPEAAGRYFNKIECFCFTEQTLQPGESVEMPVSFFVDPDIVNDSDARHISQITLSYTFYPVSKKQAAVGADQAGKKEGS